MLGSSGATASRIETEVYTPEAQLHTISGLNSGSQPSTGNSRNPAAYTFAFTRDVLLR